MSTYGVQNDGSRAVHGYVPEEMNTGERTAAAKLKWVVIVDKSLSPGQAVNAAVCVAAATAPAVPGLLDPRGWFGPASRDPPAGGRPPDARRGHAGRGPGHPGV